MARIPGKRVLKSAYFGVRLDPELRDRVQQAAAARETSPGAIVRLALREWLAAHAQETGAREGVEGDADSARRATKPYGGRHTAE